MKDLRIRSDVSRRAAVVSQVRIAQELRGLDRRLGQYVDSDVGADLRLELRNRRRGHGEVRLECGDRCHSELGDADHLHDTHRQRRYR